MTKKLILTLGLLLILTTNLFALDGEFVNGFVIGSILTDNDEPEKKTSITDVPAKVYNIPSSGYFCSGSKNFWTERCEGQLIHWTEKKCEKNQITNVMWRGDTPSKILCFDRKESVGL